MKTDEQIEKELNKLIEGMTDDQFWQWVRSWEDMDDLIDRISDWDSVVKEDAIKEIKELMKKKEEICLCCGTTAKDTLNYICDECAVEKGLKDKY